ncbi:MAG: cytochrome c3 family protein, partial [Desulfurivibrionaceae bacterium]
CGGSCHESLAINITDPLAIPESGASENGCQGCHLWTGHHDPMVASGTGPGNAYRFLGGHGGDGLKLRVDNSADGGASMEGAEWGKAGTEANIYKGQDGSHLQVSTDLPIGRFCAGCHHKFHAVGVIDDMLGEDNQGGRGISDSTPWLRHPTNVNIGDSNETGGTGGVVGEVYGAGLPLARTSFFDRGTIMADDQVMCLSCHKAHGSEYADALRWDYDLTIAHNNGGVESTTGCFYCHRTKDNQ